MKQESMYLPTMFIKFCITHCINHELITIFIYRSKEFIAVFIYRSHFVLHIFILKKLKCVVYTGPGLSSLSTIENHFE
jgi:hypothetical protein